MYSSSKHKNHPFTYLCQHSLTQGIFSRLRITGNSELLDQNLTGLSTIIIFPFFFPPYCNFYCYESTIQAVQRDLDISCVFAKAQSEQMRI